MNPTAPHQPLLEDPPIPAACRTLVSPFTPRLPFLLPPAMNHATGGSAPLPCSIAPSATASRSGSPSPLPGAREGGAVTSGTATATSARGSATTGASGKSKPSRKQVRRACAACRRSHSACEEKRPCTRCVNRGTAAADACAAEANNMGGSFVLGTAGGSVVMSGPAAARLMQLHGGVSYAPVNFLSTFGMGRNSGKAPLGDAAESKKTYGESSATAGSLAGERVEGERVAEVREKVGEKRTLSTLGGSGRSGVKRARLSPPGEAAAAASAGLPPASVQTENTLLSEMESLRVSNQQLTEMVYHTMRELQSMRHANEEHIRKHHPHDSIASMWNMAMLDEGGSHEMSLSTSSMEPVNDVSSHDSPMRESLRELDDSLQSMSELASDIPPTSPLQSTTVARGSTSAHSNGAMSTCATDSAASEELSFPSNVSARFVASFTFGGLGTSQQRARPCSCWSADSGELLHCNGSFLELIQRSTVSRASSILCALGSNITVEKLVVPRFRAQWDAELTMIRTSNVEPIPCEWTQWGPVPRGSFAPNRTTTLPLDTSALAGYPSLADSGATSAQCSVYYCVIQSGRSTPWPCSSTSDATSGGGVVSGIVQVASEKKLHPPLSMTSGSLNSSAGACGPNRTNCTTASGVAFPLRKKRKARAETQCADMEPIVPASPSGPPRRSAGQEYEKSHRTTPEGGDCDKSAASSPDVDGSGAAKRSIAVWRQGYDVTPHRQVQ